VIANAKTITTMTIAIATARLLVLMVGSVVLHRCTRGMKATTLRALEAWQRDS
jgi:hypothetical protein